MEQLFIKLGLLLSQFIKPWIGLSNTWLHFALFRGFSVKRLTKYNSSCSTSGDIQDFCSTFHDKGREGWCVLNRKDGLLLYEPKASSGNCI